MTTKSPSEALQSRIPKESWAIDFEDLQLSESIGCGGFGEVYLGKWGGVDVAVKRIWCSQKDQDEVIASFKVEIAVLTALRHPNIVLFLGACTVYPNLCFVMEYVQGGNLRKLLNDEAIELPQSLRVRFAADTAKALLYLHNKNIIHRDLKTYNLLVDDDYHVKVCDFGLARVKNAGRIMSMRGTSDWMAPEVAQGVEYDEKADVFSYGVILAEIITRGYPDDFPRLGMLKLEYELDKLRAMFPADTNPILADVCCACLSSKPADRPSMKEIVEKLGIAEKQVGPVTVKKGMPLSPTQTQTHSLNASSGKVQLGDAAANTFWLSTFSTGFQVSWEEFVKAVTGFIKTETPEGLALVKHFLIDFTTAAVTQRTLTVFLLYFHPFLRSFENARKMLTNIWFHGHCDQHTAQLLLRDKPVGTFLVRFNDAPPGSYAVTYNKADGQAVRPSNALVCYMSGKGYCTGDPTAPGTNIASVKFYPSLEDLLFHHKHRLVTPLPAKTSLFDSL